MLCWNAISLSSILNMCLSMRSSNEVASRIAMNHHPKIGVVLAKRFAPQCAMQRHGRIRQMRPTSSVRNAIQVATRRPQAAKRRKDVAMGTSPHLYPHFRTDFVLVLNEMVLVLVLDCPSRVEYEYCPSGGVRVRKTQGNWNVMFKDVGKDEDASPWTTEK